MLTPRRQAPILMAASRREYPVLQPPHRPNMALSRVDRPPALARFVQDWIVGTQFYRAGSTPDQLALAVTPGKSSVRNGVNGSPAAEYMLQTGLSAQA